MCKRNKYLVCNRISIKPFLLFVDLFLHGMFIDDGIDVSLGLWDSFKSQHSVEMYGSTGKSLLLHTKNNCPR